MNSLRTWINIKIKKLIDMYWQAKFFVDGYAFYKIFTQGPASEAELRALGAEYGARLVMGWVSGTELSVVDYIRLEGES